MLLGVYDMKINTLTIEGISRIKETLYLEFNPGMNIICGVNGTCKTTVLECITNLFSYGSSDNIKKNSLALSGKCTATTNIHGKELITYKINQFVPTEPDNRSLSGGNDTAKNLLYFKTSRGFMYKQLKAIPKDTVASNYDYAYAINRGINFDDFKGWFVNRHLFSHIKEPGLTSHQLENLEVAKKCFSILDNSISFAHVKSNTLDIMVNSQQGEIYFEYLSAGYKSCLYILLGIIKEIEFRFDALTVDKFDGILLIDEVDLHLHPTWQTTIVRSLKETFPLAQIIVTTHSPHIIQSADPNEVIPLIIDENGDVCVNKIETNEYGFKGWTVEEILQDVMGMNNVRSSVYLDAINTFDMALASEDDVSAVRNYEVLNSMLHPSNPLRAVLDIRMAGVERDCD